MKEYIERERLKVAFLEDLHNLQSVDEHTMNLILIEIDEAPAADVSPVRHGYWILHDDEFGLTCECSECHAETMGGAPYCLACGAKMDREEVRVEELV